MAYHPTLKLAVLLCCATLGLQGCGSWFGEAEDPPLPGERIAILGLERGLASDPALAGITLVVPNPEANEDWPQTGGQADHAMGNKEGSGNPRVAWKRNIGSGASREAPLTASPIVAQGRIYTMDAFNQISAFSPGGQKVWSITLPSGEKDGYFGGGIAYGEGRIFAATGFGRLFALDASNGGVIWETSTLSPVRIAPAYDNGRVYVMTLDSQLKSYLGEDGSEFWSHSGLQETTGLVGGASPAISGKAVIGAYTSGEVYALFSENGRELWNDTLTSAGSLAPVNEITDVRGAPVIANGIVYVMGYADKLIAVDLQRGIRLWEQKIGGISMPLVAGDYLFVMTNRAELVAMQASDGRIKWVRELPRFRDVEDREGEIIWGTPVMMDGRLVAANSKGEVWTFSAQDGDSIGSLSLGAGAVLAPAIAGGTIYYITDGGDLVALR